MSTPIHQLPAQQAATATSAPPVDDPEVLSMLNEMEHEVQEATKQQQQHQAAVRPPPMPVPVSTPTIAPTVKRVAPKGIWQPETAQKAVMYAAIALIIFYPATMKFIYDKLPKFESIFTSYDVIIRTIVLAIALYFGMMYLPF